jgi:hypothetical protein
MTKPTRAPSKQAALRIFINGPFTWFGLNVLSRIDPILMRVSKGRVFSSRALGLLSILLTTTGARSGYP